MKLRHRVGLVALVAAACGAAACGGDDEGSGEPIVRAVRYVVVASDDGGRERRFSGAIRAGSQSRLSFQVPGRVTDLPVKVGDRVTRGQRIAAVDPTDIQLQLQEARASAAQARASARSAAATYDRIRALYENQNASRQDLDNARAQRDGAQSASAAAGQGVRQVQRQLEYATLTAPDEGTISDVQVEANEVVGAGQVVAVLQVGEQLEVAIDLPESHITHVNRGDEVQVSVDSLADRTLTGTVYEVGVPMQGSAIYPVTIRLGEDASEVVRSGMAADVTFQFELGEEEIAQHVLPTTAVGEDRDGRFVYVVEASSGSNGERGVVRRVAVEVGEIGAEGIEIREGLEDGQRVVTAGVSRIRDGLEVRVPPLEGEAGLEEEAPTEEPSEVSEGEEG